MKRVILTSIFAIILCNANLVYAMNSPGDGTPSQAEFDQMILEDRVEAVEQKQWDLEMQLMENESNSE